MPRGGVEKKRETKCTSRWCKKEKFGRRPIGQYVGDFCSVPRGGVKGKGENRSRTDRALCRLSNRFGISFFSPCPLRWPKKDSPDGDCASCGSF